MRQSRTRKPQKPLVRKNRDRVPPTNCSGATFGVLRLIYKQWREWRKQIISGQLHNKNKPYGKVLVARLTVECHKFLNGLFLQTYYPWAFAYYARTQFSVPCRQNINLCQYRLSQITLCEVVEVPEPVMKKSTTA